MGFRRLLVASLFLSGASNAQQLTLAAVGDSITVAADADLPGLWDKEAVEINSGRDWMISRPWLSFATGDDFFNRVWSIRKRLISEGFRVKSKNFAHPGYSMQDTRIHTLPAIQDWAASIGEWPSIVTVLLGANDICADKIEQMPSEVEFAEWSKDLVWSLSGHNTKVYVMALPRIYQLQQAVGNKAVLGASSCRDFWKKTGICPTLTMTTPEELEVVKLRTEGYNKVLSEIDYPGVVFVDGTDTDVNPDDVAGDCFHPNIVGQNKIAAALWEKVSKDFH